MIDGKKVVKTMFVFFLFIILIHIALTMSLSDIFAELSTHDKWTNILNKIISIKPISAPLDIAKQIAFDWRLILISIIASASVALGYKKGEKKPIEKPEQITVPVGIGRF